MSNQTAELEARSCQGQKKQELPLKHTHTIENIGKFKSV